MSLIRLTDSKRSSVSNKKTRYTNNEKIRMNVSVETLKYTSSCNKEEVKWRPEFPLILKDQSGTSIT